MEDQQTDLEKRLLAYRDIVTLSNEIGTRMSFRVADIEFRRQAFPRDLNSQLAINGSLEQLAFWALQLQEQSKKQKIALTAIFIELRAYGVEFPPTQPTEKQEIVNA